MKIYETKSHFKKIMAEEKKLMPEFYEIAAKEIMDKRVGELPLIEKDASIDRVLSILTKSDHVWVVESKGSKKLVGIITEHDILDIFPPVCTHFVCFLSCLISYSVDF